MHKPSEKGNYRQVTLKPIGNLFSLVDSIRDGPPIESNETLTFEQLSQMSGFVLYSTNVPDEMTFPNPAILKVLGIKDRGYVFVDQVGYIGFIFNSLMYSHRDTECFAKFYFRGI